MQPNDVPSARGVADITMEEIGRTAGVSRATVYRYFPSREAVVSGVIIRAAEQYLLQMKPRIAAHGDLGSALIDFVDHTVRAARREPIIGLLFGSDRELEWILRTTLSLLTVRGPRERSREGLRTYLSRLLLPAMIVTDPPISDVTLQAWCLNHVASETRSPSYAREVHRVRRNKSPRNCKAPRPRVNGGDTGSVFRRHRHLGRGSCRLSRFSTHLVRSRTADRRDGYTRGFKTAVRFPARGTLVGNGRPLPWSCLLSGDWRGVGSRQPSSN